MTQLSGPEQEPFAPNGQGSARWLWPTPRFSVGKRHLMPIRQRALRCCSSSSESTGVSSRPLGASRLERRAPHGANLCVEAISCRTSLSTDTAVDASSDIPFVNPNYLPNLRICQNKIETDDARLYCAPRISLGDYLCRAFFLAGFWSARTSSVKRMHGEVSWPVSTRPIIHFRLLFHASVVATDLLGTSLLPLTLLRLATNLSSHHFS